MACTRAGLVDIGPLKYHETAIAKRESPIAYAFRTMTLSSIGKQQSDVTMIERAMEDIHKARFRLRDNTFVRYNSAVIYLGGLAQSACYAVV
jgi:hypothetical protein